VTADSTLFPYVSLLRTLALGSPESAASVSVDTSFRGPVSSPRHRLADGGDVPGTRFAASSILAAVAIVLSTASSRSDIQPLPRTSRDSPGTLTRSLRRARRLIHAGTMLILAPTLLGARFPVDHSADEAPLFDFAAAPGRRRHRHTRRADAAFARFPASTFRCVRFIQCDIDAGDTPVRIRETAAVIGPNQLLKAAMSHAEGAAPGWTGLIRTRL
jgi:hypothetical protein